MRFVDTAQRTFTPQSGTISVVQKHKSSPRLRQSSTPQSSLLLQPVKGWFNNSETILLARLATIGGAITSVIVEFEFSPLWSVLSTGTDFTGKQIFWIGVSIVGAGITIELARRRP